MYKEKLPVEGKPPKFIAPELPEYEFFWCVMKPMRIFKYKNI